MTKKELENKLEFIQRVLDSIFLDDGLHVETTLYRYVVSARNAICFSRIHVYEYHGDTSRIDEV